jgi:thymidylate synthase
MIDEPVLITYSHPKERVLFNAARDANPFFTLYEQLWMLAGRNDVDSVAYYVKKMMEFSDDGKTLNGSAYGYRWRAATTHPNAAEYSVSGYGRVDQLDVIVEHLKADPNSRRAVLTMWNVEDDLLKIGCKVEHRPINEDCNLNNNGNRCTCPPEYPPSKDVCCNLNVMFSLREVVKDIEQPYDAEELGQRIYPTETRRYLDMTVTNRSNDMVLGMLGSDYATFTILQEYMAARLGVEVGKYNHFTNNLHVYTWNWKPDEWLAEEVKTLDGYQSMRLLGTEKPEMFKLVPLVKDPAVFDREVQSVVTNCDGRKRTWRFKCEELFLDGVALPMFDAHYVYKHGSMEEALKYAREIQADDWRIACTNWLQRRMK